MFTNGLLNSFMFGLISAVSLPLGALTIIFWKPKERVIAAFMAFGGGALLAALTIDLVGSALQHEQFYPLAFGSILGGIFFVILDQLVSSQGGFLRKTATTYTYLNRKKTKAYKELLQKLSVIALFRNLPREEIQELLPYIVQVTYEPGSVIMKQDEPGDRLLLIEEGVLDIIDTRHNKTIATLTTGDVVGEIALVTGENRSASVIAQSTVAGWEIKRDDFYHVVNRSGELAQAFHSVTEKRIELLQNAQALDEIIAHEWRKKASMTLEGWITKPSDDDIKKASEEHHGAPFAIWLGILLDGIPESLVIGASTVHATISLSLLAGLFLSNYPEALSSSMGMRKQGRSFFRIVMMWGSLTIITGVGAFIGNIFFQKAPDWLFAFIQGSAAGAMLTMISQTMLPEAFRRGGWITGLSTLAGFLAAIFFKTLE